MALISSRGIGNAGAMEIHDDGSTVVMRIRSADGATNSGAIPVRVYIGGWSDWFTVNYPSGSPWVHVWSGTVASTQWVAFEVGATGTDGFGNGGDLGGSISRATVPPAPNPYSPDQITQTSMRFRFDSRGTGGGPLLRWEAQWSTTVNFSTGNGPVVPSSGTTVFTDLIPDTNYYCRGRGVNTFGNGAWSPPMGGRTLPGGLRGGKGGSFVPFPTVVGKSSVFVDVPIFIGKGGSFVPLG